MKLSKIGLALFITFAVAGHANLAWGFGYATAKSVTFEVTKISLKAVDGTEVVLVSEAAEHTFESDGASSFVPSKFADFDVDVGRYVNITLCTSGQQKLVLENSDFRGPDWAGHAVKAGDKLWTTGVGMEVSTSAPAGGAVAITVGESGVSCADTVLAPTVCISESGDECEAGDQVVTSPNLYLLGNLNYAVNVNAGRDGTVAGEPAAPGNVGNFGGELIPTIGQPGAVMVLTQNTHLIGPTAEIAMIALVFSPNKTLIAINGRHSGDIPGFCGSVPFVKYDDDSWRQAVDYDAANSGRVRWMTRTTENLGHGVVTVADIHQAVGETTSIRCDSQDDVIPPFLGLPSFTPVGMGAYINETQNYNKGPMDWKIFKIVDPGKNVFADICPSGFCQATAP
jgi:hypothetical protein